MMKRASVLRPAGYGKRGCGKKIGPERRATPYRQAEGVPDSHSTPVDADYPGAGRTISSNHERF
jgi:hypothetical protein